MKKQVKYGELKMGKNPCFRHLFARQSGGFGIPTITYYFIVITSDQTRFAGCVK